MGADCRQPLAVRVAPETLEKLELMAKEQGISKGLIIDQIVTKLKQ